MIYRQFNLYLLFAVMMIVAVGTECICRMAGTEPLTMLRYEGWANALLFVPGYIGFGVMLTSRATSKLRWLLMFLPVATGIFMLSYDGMATLAYLSDYQNYSQGYPSYFLQTVEDLQRCREILLWLMSGTSLACVIAGL